MKYIYLILLSTFLTTSVFGSSNYQLFSPSETRLAPSVGTNEIIDFISNNTPSKDRTVSNLTFQEQVNFAVGIYIQNVGIIPPQALDKQSEPYQDASGKEAVDESWTAPDYRSIAFNLQLFIESVKLPKEGFAEISSTIGTKSFDGDRWMQLILRLENIVRAVDIVAKEESSKFKNQLPRPIGSLLQQEIRDLLIVMNTLETEVSVIPPGTARTAASNLVKQRLVNFPLSMIQDCLSSIRIIAQSESAK